MANVVVADADASVVAILHYHLDSAGHRVAVAEDVTEAWRRLEGESPEVAVVDSSMADAWQFIERARNDTRYTDLFVIALVEPGDDGARRRAEVLGCATAEKPVSAAEIARRISVLVDQTSGGGMTAANEGPVSRHRVEMVVVPVVLLLDAYRIEGRLHLPPELGRFSDAWESVMRDQRDYVPVTDVQIKSLDGSEIVGSPFIEVRKADIRAVFPLDVPT